MERVGAGLDEPVSILKSIAAGSKGTMCVHIEAAPEKSGVPGLSPAGGKNTRGSSAYT